ncbi:hypothetical protein FSARC_4806, partial [Fusarium sarcochroum]
MKVTLVFGTLATLAMQSQACVTLTIKDDFKANTYSWAVWKDGKREYSFAHGGPRPITVDGNVGNNFYSVNVYGEFHKLSGKVTKYTAGKYVWD